MPYIDLPGGGKIWEGPRTEREEMELMRGINGVARFPSANHRAKVRRTQKVDKEKSQMKYIIAVCFLTKIIAVTGCSNQAGMSQNQTEPDEKKKCGRAMTQRAKCNQ